MVALVTGLIGLFPVAIPVGIVALVRVRQRHERGRGLAIGGLVAATGWLLVAGLVAVALVAGAFSSGDEPLGPVSQAGSTIVGSCLRSGGPVDEAVACTGPHDEEVFASETLQGEASESADDIAGTADDACYDAYGPYVGRSYDRSRYDYAFYAPTAEQWRAGERRYVCVVVPTDSDDLPVTVAHSGADPPRDDRPHLAPPPVRFARSGQYGSRRPGRHVPPAPGAATRPLRLLCRGLRRRGRSTWGLFVSLRCTHGPARRDRCPHSTSQPVRFACSVVVCAHGLGPGAGSCPAAPLRAVRLRPPERHVPPAPGAVRRSIRLLCPCLRPGDRSR